MPKRILVAESERHIARLVEVNLERAGYVVVAVATSEQEALTLARTEQPELVVISAWMTGLASQLEADPLTAHIRVTPLPVRPTSNWLTNLFR